MTEDWTVQKARDTYNIQEWSDGYFDINDEGCLIARPDINNQMANVDLSVLVSDLKAAGLSLPVLVRFNDILQSRITELHDAFSSAMQHFDYDADYTAVYPIKVNQQRRVVETIVHQTEARVGLEAGSKPELLAVLAMSGLAPSTIICNGYKDREYIRLALIARQLGHHVYIIIEKSAELETILEESDAMDVEPLLGVRIRLMSVGAGKWQNSGGEKSKFGLTASQVLAVVDRLKQTGHESALQLLHFHLGSQVANIRDIQKGLHECARYYAELHRLGVKIHTVDVGGGLGVDYEGTQSRQFCSMNYSIQAYANNIVQIFKELCVKENLTFPALITESGRAMTAHHAVLITDVIHVESFSEEVDVSLLDAKVSSIIHSLREIYEKINSRNAVEAYHDAKHWLSEVQGAYLHDGVTLSEKAQAEQLYIAIIKKVREHLLDKHRAHRDMLDKLNETLADKFFCNFSVFQSLPDVWAIDQIFPVMPLSQLNTPPVHRAILQDITCDSDGCIDQYVDGHGLERTLPLPAYKEGKEYYLGIFLVGAYQEILGDMHNLFGDTDSAHVEIAEDGTYRLVELLRGDSVEDVLDYVHFDADNLKAMYQTQLEDSSLSSELQGEYMAMLLEGLGGYTYFES